MDDVNIKQICKSNLKKEDVNSSKMLMYQLMGELDQMQPRR